MGRYPKGNPHWGKGGAPIPDKPTEFDQMIERLGITTIEGCAASPEACKWVRRHAGSKYVPEAVLLAIGLEPEFEGDDL